LRIRHGITDKVCKSVERSALKSLNEHAEKS
jgi:hypothetical protein